MHYSKLFLAAILVVLIAGAGAYVMATQNEASPAQVVTSPSITPSGTTTPIQATIEGTLVYPSEAIPNELKVCARNQSTQQELCTSEHLHNARFRTGQGYRLVVPTGSYMIYATLSTENGPINGYYSKFVTDCRYGETCQDHTKLMVSALAGQTITGIEPGDFYTR